MAQADSRAAVFSSWREPNQSVGYTRHFGLTAAPFAIAPDPRYLYMSERHREALAHLLYGIGEDGSIVQLTGEVGTGKTTLCRWLIDQLPPTVDVALIFNACVSATELLAAVCDELGIPYPPGGATGGLKALVDALFRHLLESHSRGRRTVLIIDEAQGLPVDVLEQIRLLTNLETAEDKLLQVILIGQPELVQLLDQHTLRQLAQRITVRYHLTPFSLSETERYIHHRLEVAGQKRRIFTDAAVRRVHGWSGGIPRLINLICERSLLGAYARERRTVSAAMVDRAGREIRGRRVLRRWGRPGGRVLAVASLAMALAGAWPMLSRWWLADFAAPIRARVETSWARSSALVLQERDRRAAIALDRSLGQTGAPRTQGDKGLASVRLVDVLGRASGAADLRSAFAVLLTRWGAGLAPADEPLICHYAQRQGLRCGFGSGTWRKLRLLDLPAIIELRTMGRKYYATVIGLDHEQATLHLGAERFTFPVDEINGYWDGSFIFLWRPSALTSIPIRPGDRGRDVEGLRQHLAQLDGSPAPRRRADLYDEELKDRVALFQRRHGLRPDGVLGPETLVLMTMSPEDPTVPRLSVRTR